MADAEGEMAEGRCSCCGHLFSGAACEDCGREFCCGEAGEDCDREGCADRVIAERLVFPPDSRWLERLPREAPRRAAG